MWDDLVKEITKIIQMTIRIPADWEPHACCLMAWAVHQEWGRAINKVKRELSEVVQTIARFEPVRVLSPRGHALREAQREFSGCSNVTIIEAPVDDIWMRDIAPTFAIRDEAGAREIVAIDWNFNGWGGTKDRPPRPGDKIARTATSIFGVPRISVPFVAEAGALVTDGQGTLITTRSCLLNPNRNPVRRERDCQQMIEMELAKLGVNRVIWLEGDPCEPLTSGHADGYLLCAPSGVVLVETYDDDEIEPPMWRNHDVALLENAVSANGTAFKVTQVHAPRWRYWASNADTFAPCYLNVYVTNGAVIGARFGDPQRDRAAKRALSTAFPGREIIMIGIDHIAEGGGGFAASRSRCLGKQMAEAIDNLAKQTVGMQALTVQPFAMVHLAKLATSLRLLPLAYGRVISIAKLADFGPRLAAERLTSSPLPRWAKLAGNLRMSNNLRVGATSAMATAGQRFANDRYLELNLALSRWTSDLRRLGTRLN